MTLGAILAAGPRVAAAAGRRVAAVALQGHSLVPAADEVSAAPYERASVKRHLTIAGV